MNNHLNIPVIFNIHVEPDLRIIKYKKNRWTGYENLHDFLFKIRPQLEKATGRKVNYNWLLRLDPQIEHAYGSTSWAINQYRSLLNESIAMGDELGVHVHSWKPYKKWFYKSWIADFSDDRWIKHCIETAHNTFIDSLNIRPNYFSFGDHFMSNDVLTQLESLGYRCDLSMQPGRPPIREYVKNELSRGWLPDYTSTPRSPFKPSHQDFAQPIKNDERQIWEIPVSVGSIQDSMGNKRLDKLLLGMPFQQASSIIEENLALPDTYILAEMRTDVRMDNFNCAQFDQAIEYFISHPSANKMSFCTVNDFATQLDQKVNRPL